MRFKRSSDSIRLNGGFGVGVRETVNECGPVGDCGMIYGVGS